MSTTEYAFLMLSLTLPGCFADSNDMEGDGSETGTDTTATGSQDTSSGEETGSTGGTGETGTDSDTTETTDGTDTTGAGSCGDGDLGDDEECDDGNAIDEDECTNACLLPVCGDGIVHDGEACDDGNRTDLDGCQSDCSISPGVAQVEGGRLHTCARFHDRSLRCWGFGGGGRLGYANIDDIGDDELPNSIGLVDIGGPVTFVSAGEVHTCAIMEGGSVRCFGDAGQGRLGYGNQIDIGDDEVPAAAGDVMVGGTVLELGIGTTHTCVLHPGGSVRCWGGNPAGQLGYGNLEHVGDDEVPADVGTVDVGGTVTSISVGARHTCVILDDQSVRCWGLGTHGRLGYGNEDSIGDDEVPADVGTVDVGGPVVDVAAGLNHTCALLEGNIVRCWGQGAYGMMGQGNLENIGDDEVPADVAPIDIGGTVVEIEAGRFHTCVILDDGAVRCWGLGAQGQLGYANTENVGDDELPASAGDVNVGVEALQLSAGYRHTCVRGPESQLRCWGLGELGRLGYGNIDSIGDSETPASAGDVPCF